MATTSSQPDPLDASNPSRPGRERRRGWWRRFRKLPRTLRVTSYVAVALVLVLVAGALTGTMLVRRSYPQTSGTVELPGLDAEVEVLRDEHGIPQIYADTTEDLMAAQGYVHAQERFFEMDVRRHVTAGRLAELFGEDAVETDAFVRTMGWRRVAERELGLLAPGTRTALDAYAGGVNAYLKDRAPSEISLEYAVLGVGGLDYRPAKWDAVDSLAWLKAMAWDLRGNMEEEIQRALAIGAVGAERAAELWPSYDYDEHPPIVDQGAVVDGVFEQDATAGGTRNPVRPPPFDGASLRELARVGRGLARMPALLGRGDGIGSNSWVVSGERTTTGGPLLANDPHLGVSLPGIWMQVGLHCRTVSEACPYDVAGFSFSGVPGVVIGHNADIAWGFTNQGTDVSDLYLERVRGDRWSYGRGWRPLDTRTETIEVAGGDPVEITVRSTDHGPLLSDADEAVDGVLDDVAGEPPAAGVETAVALQWTALRPAPTMDAVLELNRADDWDSFRKAAADLAAPAQNIVYADRDGHVGYQATGLTPIRKSGHDGTMPVAGWRPENDWTGETVPFDGLPNVLDPESGLVVTANQAVTRPDYDYFLTDDYDRGYRAARIGELLGDRDDLSAADLLDIQRDDRNPMAPVLVPYLLHLNLARGYFSDGQRTLEGWDFRQPADGAGSAAAAYYNVVWSNLLRLTFDDELPLAAEPDGGDRWMAVVAELLEQPGSAWWDDVDTEEVERRDDVLREAMRAARDELTSRQAVNPDEWSWGRLHALELRSSTLGESGIGAVERLFNRGPWDAPGGSAVVDATSWDAREGYEVTAAPSMRMVVDLDDLDASRWINLTGVSGHAFHDHYTDQTDLFVAGDTLPWAFSRDAVEAASEDELILERADAD